MVSVRASNIFVISSLSRDAKSPKKKTERGFPIVLRFPENFLSKSLFSKAKISVLKDDIGVKSLEILQKKLLGNSISGRNEYHVLLVI